jgi:two-component system phosphate regulon response regulator OmpR
MTDNYLSIDSPHIMIVDDDSRLRTLLDRYLKQNKFRVTCAADGPEARQQLTFFDFDLLIIDVMMPGETGLKLTNDLRRTMDVPILLLTAMNEPDDRIAGLESGADDYLSKPFEPRELVLRIQKILRRLGQFPIKENYGNSVKFGPFQYDLNQDLLYKGREITKLTESEARILRAFAESPGIILSREDLIKVDGEYGNARTVDVQITRLRRKLEDDPKFPRYLKTIRGQGYILKTKS